LEALSGKNQISHEKVWMRGVADYVSTRLPELAKQFGETQTPLIVSIGLDFPITSQ
jgi:hypothetical protein